MPERLSGFLPHGVEVRQKPGETLRAFISRFTKVRGTIPHISDASIITAFLQGVRDEKMLEKLATHKVESVTTLFSLADKCARAPAKAPKVQPSNPDDVPVKTVQIGVDSSRTTRIVGNLDEK